MHKLEHIGIAVKSLSHSIPLFESLLNTNCYKKEEVESEGVVTAFFSLGDQKIELLESTDPDGIIEKYIRKRGEGIHQVLTVLMFVSSLSRLEYTCQFRMERSVPEGST